MWVNSLPRSSGLRKPCGDTQNGAACITLQNKKRYLVQQLWCWSKTTKALRCITEDLRCRMGPTDGRKQLLVLAANIIHPRCDSDIEHCVSCGRPQKSRSAHVWASDWQISCRMPYLSCFNLPPLPASSACSFVTHLHASSLFTFPCLAPCLSLPCRHTGRKVCSPCFRLFTFTLKWSQTTKYNLLQW